MEHSRPMVGVVLSAGHWVAAGWACPRLGKDTRPTSPNGLGALVPRGLPSPGSVFEGQQPCYTPGSDFSTSFKGCDGNRQMTASCVHVRRVEVSPAQV